MSKMKSYVDKEFLFEFQDTYLEMIRNPFDSKSEDQLAKLQNISKALRASDVWHTLDKDELLSIIKGEDHPFLKLVLKDGQSVSYDQDLFEQFEELDGKTYFSKAKHKDPFQSFYLPNRFEKKKTRRYTEYFGHHFITTSQIPELAFIKQFHLGEKERPDVVQRVYNTFRPFNALVIIDRYFLNKDDLFPNFLNGVFANGKRLKQDVYIDVICDQDQFDKALGERRISMLENALNTIKSAHGLANIVLKVHHVRSAVFHDRYVIGNGFMIHLGHGMEAFKQPNDTESSVTFRSVLHHDDEASAITTIVSKLQKLKKAIGNLSSDNPIWRIID